MDIEINSKKERRSVAQFLRISWRALRLVTRDHKLLFVWLCSTLFFSTLLSFVASWFFAQAVNAISTIGKAHIASLQDVASFFILHPYLLVLIAGWTLVPLLRELISRAEVDARQLFSFHLDSSLDVINIKQRIALDVASFEDKDRQDLISKASRSMFRLLNFINAMIAAIDGLFGFIIASVALGYFYWWIIPIMLIGITPSLIAQFVFGRGEFVIWSRNSKLSRMYNHLYGYFSDSSRIAEMRIFQNLEFFAQKAISIIEKIRTETVLHLRKAFRYKLVSGLFGDIVRASIIVFFVIEAIRGNTSIGSLVFLVGAVANLQGSVRSLFSSLGNQYENLLYVEDILKFLDLKPLVEAPTAGLQLPSKIAPRIVFENVSFTYPGQERKALDNVSFVIEPGQKVGVVGINGAGKTTFTKLLSGFYHPTQGKIFVGGINLRELDLSSWYGNLAVLFQEFGRYKLLLREVIAAGDTTRPAEDAHIEKALHQADADFTKQYKEKLDTQIGIEFGGEEPSGGQNQKLAVARLLFRVQQKAWVLVLDEPTAALDAESEASIFETLEKLPKDKTVILISHRFSTLRNADKIFVFDGGKLIEEGSHSQLMQKNGKYAQLFTAQAAGYQ